MRGGLVRAGSRAGELEQHAFAHRHRVDHGQDALRARGVIAVALGDGNRSASEYARDGYTRVLPIGRIVKIDLAGGGYTAAHQRRRPARASAVVQARNVIRDHEVGNRAFAVVGDGHAVVEGSAGFHGYIAFAGNPVDFIAADRLADGDIIRRDDGVLRRVRQGLEACRAQGLGQGFLRKLALFVAEGDARRIIRVGGNRGFGVEIRRVDDFAVRSVLRLHGGGLHLATDGELELNALLQRAGHAGGDHLARHIHGYAFAFRAIERGAGLLHHKAIGNDVGQDGIDDAVFLVRPLARGGDGVFNHIQRAHAGNAFGLALDARFLIDGRARRFLGFGDSHLRVVRCGGGGGDLRLHAVERIRVGDGGPVLHRGDGHNVLAAILPDVDGDGDRFGREAGGQFAVRAGIGDAEALIAFAEIHGLLRGKGKILADDFPSICALAFHRGCDARGSGPSGLISIVRRGAIAGRANGDAFNVPVDGAFIHFARRARLRIRGPRESEAFVHQLRLIHRQGHGVGELGNGEGNVLPAFLLEAADRVILRRLIDGSGHIFRAGQVGKHDHNRAAIRRNRDVRALGRPCAVGARAHHARPIEIVLGHVVLRHRIRTGNDVFKEAHGVVGGSIGVVAICDGIAVQCRRIRGNRSDAAGGVFRGFTRNGGASGGEAAARGRVLPVGIVVFEHGDARVRRVVRGERHIRVLLRDGEETAFSRRELRFALIDLNQFQHIAVGLGLLNGVAIVALELGKVRKG